MSSAMGGKGQEYSDMLKAAWKAYHAKNDLGRTKGLPLQKMRALHLRVFSVMTWYAGTTGWTLAELRGLKTLKLRMTRSACGWWPRKEEE